VTPRLRSVLVAVFALLTAGACAPAPARWVTPHGSATPSVSAASPTATPEITLTFAGDVHFAQRTLTLLEKDPQTAFGPVADIFGASDLAMVNLETAVTDRGTPEPKQFHFRAPSTAFEAILAAGIDVVTMANNHALDYGRVGLDDSLGAAKAAGMPVVGIGEDAAHAYAPFVAEVKGVKIAFLGMSQVAELSGSWAARDDRSGIAMAFNTTKAVAAVKAAAKAADVVVVYMHWGQEYNQCPTAAMKTFAKKIADAGATMIIGTHAHVLQGGGWLGSTYVEYGLSNFLWWYNDAGSNDTGVLRVTLTGTRITKTEFLPAYIDRKTGQPIPSTGAEATRISKKYAGLHGCTGLAAAAP
jgi:poly-gamma-glutamate capsule biosynthesis protein CapA/YwtB (metallophosphatase superfamily)